MKDDAGRIFIAWQMYRKLLVNFRKNCCAQVLNKLQKLFGHPPSYQNIRIFAPKINNKIYMCDFGHFDTKSMSNETFLVIFKRCEKSKIY